MDNQISPTGGNPNVTFSVAKEDFAGAVAWVARSLPTRPTQPILRALVITAYDSELEIFGYDYEISTKVRIPAEVTITGQIAVAGKLLADIVNNLPNKTIQVGVEKSKVVVACGTSRFELPLIPMDEYPQIPQMPGVSGTIDPLVFSEAVSQVALAAGKDETLPMLTGVFVQIEGSRLLMAATDRFRLAVRSLEWDPTHPDVKGEVLIPAKTLQDHARTIDSSHSEPLTLALGDGQEIYREGLLGLRADTRETTTRMLVSDFPKFQPLLPQKHRAMASIAIEPLKEAIRRVSLVAAQNSQIRMEFSSGQVILSASNTESGHAEETIECAFSGEDLLIAFNPNYLKDGLSVIHTDRVVFGFNEPSRPAIMVPEPEDIPARDESGMFPTPETEFTYLLMPVRLPG